jgi:hypothetical protein
MPTYFALVSQNCIQMDLTTGQLEVYEDEESAKNNCPDGCEVVPINVTRIVEA